MKKMKKLMALMLAAIMIFAPAAESFAVTDISGEYLCTRSKWITNSSGLAENVLFTLENAA